MRERAHMADRVVALVADGSVLRARHQHRVEALTRPRPRAFLNNFGSVVCNVLRPTCRRAVPCVPCEYARNTAARLLWGFGLGFGPIALRCLGISDGRADDQRLSGSVPSHRGSVIASVTQFKKIAPTVMRSNHTDASSFCSHVSAHRDHPRQQAVFLRGLFPNGAAETESQSAVTRAAASDRGAQGQAHADRRTHRNTPCKCLGACAHQTASDAHACASHKVTGCYFRPFV